MIKISSDIRYYIIHPRWDKSKITLLEYSIDAHDIYDFDLFDERAYKDPYQCMLVALDISIESRHILEYEEFSSRYTRLTTDDIVNQNYELEDE